MARKKVELALQQEIETADQWNDLLSREGLIVVDAYQEWCGPCKALENVLKKIKLDMGDSLLKFAVAKADTIPALEDYRGRCEPCFLFYAGRCLVAIVRGANAPAIIKTIQEQLAYEHKVLKGEAERKPITDPVIEKINKQKAKAKADAQVEHIMQSTKPITICIIKPDIIAKNRKDEIIHKIKERGYEIVEQKDVKFTEEMAKEFYKHQQDSPHFNELIKYMTSDVSCVLALSKEGNTEDVVNSWRNEIGPADPEQAKKNPESFRAQYATSQIVNGVHASDSHESAMRELAYFFPEAANNQNSVKHKQQRTLALIRPSAFAQHKEAILKKIHNSGFEIAMAKTVQFDKNQAEEFYAEHKEKPFFNDLVKEMTSGQMMVLCLVKENAVSSWREMLGPKEKEKIKEASGTLRHEFDVETSPVNALHGASTPEQAEKELAKFFPIEQTVAIIKPGLPPEKINEIENKIKESGFLIASKKSQKLTEEIAKDIYKDAENKSYFKGLVDLMTSGETEVLILSREDAINGWRELIGPVDPAKAKQENPNSLRALYGLDVLNNGLHGPSNKQQAENELKVLFGDVKFDKNGNLIKSS